MTTFTVTETKMCVHPDRLNYSVVQCCRGNRGAFYVFDDELYDSHFPTEWLAKHREFRVGPSYCNICRKNSWNGVFFGYCIHCAWMTFQGKRGRGMITPGNEASVQYIDALIEEPSPTKMISIFDTYMKGVGLDQIGDTDLCDSMAIHMDTIVEFAREHRTSPQIMEAAVARMEEKHTEVSMESETDNLEFSEFEDNDVDILYHRPRKGAGGMYYSYHGQYYTEQFPERWLIADAYFRTGPEFCDQCRRMGRWNGVCIGYCVPCANLYHGTRGRGFIFPGCEATTIGPVTATMPREEQKDPEEEVFDELDECSAFNTYLMGYQLHEFGDPELEDTWKERESEFYQMNDTIVSPELRWRIRHEKNKP